MSQLHGKVAVVTGAGSGIGAATAKPLAVSGATVIAADLHADTAQAIVDTITATGAVARAVTLDVSKEEQFAHALESAALEFGRLDILVNNAGASRQDDTNIVDTPEDAWRFSLDVNLMGVVYGVRHAIPHMLATGGSMVNVASAGPLFGDHSLIAYAAAKAGVISLTKYTAASHGHAGIRCNAIAPGLVLSEGVREHFPYPAVLEAVSRHQTLERLSRQRMSPTLQTFSRARTPYTSPGRHSSSTPDRQPTGRRPRTSPRCSPPRTPGCELAR